MKELISKKKNFKGMARIERLETQLLCSYASALENLQSQHALLKDLVTFTSNRATHLCKFRKSLLLNMNATKGRMNDVKSLGQHVKVRSRDGVLRQGRQSDDAPRSRPDRRVVRDSSVDAFHSERLTVRDLSRDKVKVAREAKTKKPKPSASKGKRLGVESCLTNKGHIVPVKRVSFTVSKC